MATVAEVRQLAELLGPAPRPFADLSAEALGRRLTALSPTQETLVRLAVFDASGYTRTTLIADDSWEIAIIGWLPGQATTIHDHGLSVGATLVVSGTLTETQFRQAGPRRATAKGRRRVGPRGLVLETPGWIHRVANDGRERAVSLHLYVPAIVETQVFEERSPRLSKRAISIALGTAAKWWIARRA